MPFLCHQLRKIFEGQDTSTAFSHLFIQNQVILDPSPCDGGGAWCSALCWAHLAALSRFYGLAHSLTSFCTLLLHWVFRQRSRSDCSPFCGVGGWLRGCWNPHRSVVDRICWHWTDLYCHSAWLLWALGYPRHRLVLQQCLPIHSGLHLTNYVACACFCSVLWWIHWWVPYFWRGQIISPVPKRTGGFIWWI